MRDFFRAEGYCVVDGVFSEKECEDLNAAADAFLRRQGDDEKYKPLMNPDRESAVIASAVCHRKLVKLAEALLGSRIEAVQTQYFWKPPGALGHDPHQDNYYVRSDQDAFIAAWVALEDAGSRNGGLVAYPRSHLEPILPVQEVHVPPTSRPLYPNQRGRETLVPIQYKPLPLEVKPGATIFMHGHLVHSSLDNLSQHFRRSFLVDYLKDGAPFAVGRYANRKRMNVYSDSDGK